MLQVVKQQLELQSLWLPNLVAYFRGILLIAVFFTMFHQCDFIYSNFLSSVQFGRSVMSDFLWPHGLQHTSLPCSSPTLAACSNSCPLSRWCHPTISSSVIPFSSCLQSFPASGFCLTWAYSYHLGKYFFQSCPDNGHTLIINYSVKLSLICQQNKSQTIFLTQN